MNERTFVPVDYEADPHSLLWDEASINLQSILVKVITELPWYENILCSVSGGWDSDILIDMMERFGGHGKTTYIFLNTGLEYDATKRHIKELEERYGVKIEEVRPKKPIPACIHSYGLPFWSKYVSQMPSGSRSIIFNGRTSPLRFCMPAIPGARPLFASGAMTSRRKMAKSPNSTLPTFPG